MNDRETQITGMQSVDTGEKPTFENITDLTKRAGQMIRGEDNQGCFENPDVRGKYTGWCGDSMQIDLIFEGERIRDARFSTDGCWATVSCGNAVIRLACARTLEDALQITPDDVLEITGELPAEHEHCAELSVRTLRVAIHNALNGH